MRVTLLFVATFLVNARAQDAKPPAKSQPTDKAVQSAPAAASLADLLKDVSDKTAESAAGWAIFLANGCKGEAELFGTGEHAEAELALSGAIDAAVKPAVDGLNAKKGSVKLNDAVEGIVSKVGTEGFTVTVKKVESVVPWTDVDPKNLAVLISRGKPTDEPTLAAIAMLRLLSGDTADAKRQSTKLTSPIGKQLGELLDFSKALLPELKAARALETALRDADPTRALDRMKAAWNDAKSTKLGEQGKKRLAESYIARGEKAYSGQAALAALIHGKIVAKPAKGAADGAGGTPIEIEYEFEKDSEGADFDPATVPRFLHNMLKGINRGPDPPVAFKVNQSRLKTTGCNGGVLPIDFVGDLEIESIGGLNDDLQGGRDLGFIAVGFTTADGSHQAFMIKQCVMQTSIGGRPGPTAERKFPNDRVFPGMQCDSVLKLAGGKLSISLNGDASRALDFAVGNTIRVFVLGASYPDWNIERLVLRGTVTAACMDGLAHTLSERQAKALFGE